MRQSPKLRMPCLGLTAVMLLLSLADSALSTSLRQVRLPTTGLPSQPNSLRMDIALGGMNHYGYAPFHLTFTSPTPVAADRSITVRIELISHTGKLASPYNVAIEQDVDLPAGAKNVEMEIVAPAFISWRSFTTKVWVDGVIESELCEGLPAPTSGHEYLYDVFSPGDPEVDAISSSFVDIHTGGPQYNFELHQGAMPHDWRAHTCYDSVVLSVAELSNLSAADPAAFSALQKWLAAGGFLVVEKTGEQLSELPKVEQLLDLNSDPFNLVDAREMRDIDLQRKSEAEGEEDEPLSSKTTLNLPNSATPEWNWVQIRVPVNNARSSAGNSSTSGNQRRFVSEDAWFAERSFGFGRIAAFPKGYRAPPVRPGTYDNPFLSQFLYERGFQSRALAQYCFQHDWNHRHGLTPDAGNAAFSNWLVPGVGAAPVDAFRWLITLFVVVVGPLSFLALRLTNRSHLLVLTAPLMAALFTGGLYAYATLSDGLDTRVRVRSVAFIDQEKKTAASWSRQSYYAGMAPADGMVFPRSAAVYPLLPVWKSTTTRGRIRPTLEVLVDESSQRLTNGWLPSRDTSQFLIIDHRECKARLDIETTGKTPRAHNRVGTDIAAMYVIDQQGEWWVGLDVPSGSAVKLKPTSRSSVVAKLRETITDSAPDFPVGLDPSSTYRGSRSAQISSQAYERAGLESSKSLLNGNRLESLINRLAGMDSGLPAPLGKGAYLLVTHTAVAAPIGVPDAKEDGSLHLTVGRWAP